MTLVKTKQMTFILGRLPTIHAFKRQTTREKRVFVFFFLLPLQLGLAGVTSFLGEKVGRIHVFLFRPHQCSGTTVF